MNNIFNLKLKRKMANMSYCRFENTYADLYDCYEAFYEFDELSESEKKYALKLIKLCADLVADHKDLLEQK